MTCPSSHVPGLSTGAIYFPSRKQLKLSTNTMQRAWAFNSNNNRACCISCFMLKLIYRFKETRDERHPWEAGFLQAAVAPLVGSHLLGLSLLHHREELQRPLLFWVQITVGPDLQQGRS